MIAKSIVEEALGAALRSGGDFAELFCEDTRSGNVALIDGSIDSAVTNRLHGAGLRVYKALKSVYVHTNDTSREGLMRLAREAAAAIGEAGADAAVSLTRSIERNAHAILRMPLDASGSAKAKLLHDAYAAAKAYDPAISQVRTQLMLKESDVLIANSEGMYKTDARVYTRFAVSAVASSGTENQTGFEAPGAMRGFEVFDEQIDVVEQAREAARVAVTMLRAQPCPAGFMPVVIGNGFGGVIFHEACGHSLEATQVALGNSEFCGKLGQAIATPIVSAVDDGTLPNEWGSENIDDEGNPTTRLMLIEKGVLKNYMIDRLNARRMNMPVTGSGRRQDYTFAPTSRMRNTYILPGEDENEEIIASAGDALYAKKMGGGSVNPATGEFNFAVGEGYLIRGGKIEQPVRGAMLIGKGGEVLRRIDRVGRDLAMGQGMCGSLSGSVPTNVGQPMIRVTGLTVGGQQGGK